MEATGSGYSPAAPFNDWTRTYQPSARTVIDRKYVINAREDWAETVAYVLVPDSRRYEDFHEDYLDEPTGKKYTDRLGYVEAQFGVHR
jgi:hypothetical protein